MNKDIENICISLDNLSTAILNAWTGDGTFTEHIGWMAPAITRQELASISKNLADDIRNADIEDIEEDIVSMVADIPRRVQLIQAHNLPQFFNAKSGQAIPAYINTLRFWRDKILPRVNCEKLDNKALPTNIARRARAAEVRMNEIEPSLENLSEVISNIQKAHDVADNLTIDLDALAETRKATKVTHDEIVVILQKIKDANDEASSNLNNIKTSEIEASRLVEQTETAYHITTTKGLAGAFDQRAEKLGISMLLWVSGLIIALIIGAYIGAKRFEVLTAALTLATPNWGIIVVEICLSLLSVGGPLWFAWLATKQVGQRFRLAEDYAFKASVAKAYEGFKKEAGKLDPKFESQLFSLALNRLDEAPLRFVEHATHASPLNEIANSEIISKLVALFPESQDKIIGIVRDAVKSKKS